MTDGSWRVKLEVPSETRYLHIVRLATAGAAAEAGLDAAEIEDLKIAVDELCSLAIGSSATTGPLVVEFRSADGRLTIEATAPAAEREVEIDELSLAILTATVDSHEFDPEALGGGFRLTKSRRGA